MRVVICIFALGLAARCGAQTTNATVEWVFGNFTMSAQNATRVYITPLGALPGSPANFPLGRMILQADRQVYTNVINGTLIVSNVVTPGNYQVDFVGPYITTTITNAFPLTNGFLNAVDWLYPGSTPWITPYSQNQSDARFLQNLTSSNSSVQLYLTPGPPMSYDLKVVGGGGGGVFTAVTTNLVASTNGNVVTIGGQTDTNVVGIIATNVASIVSTNVAVFESQAAVNTYALAANPGIVFVDAGRGNDSTGIAGNPQFPFATLSGGMNAATSGNTVYAVSGTFQETVVPKANVSLNFAAGTTFNQPGSAPAIIAKNGDLTVLGQGNFNGNANTNFLVMSFNANVSAININVPVGGFFFPMGNNQTLTITANSVTSRWSGAAPGTTGVTWNLYVGNFAFNDVFNSWQDNVAINTYNCAVATSGVVMTNTTVNTYGGKVTYTGTTFVNWRYHDTALASILPATNGAYGIVLSGDSELLP